jgi:hypothetical protein
MTQFAQFDSTVAAPSPIIGWYDTTALTYPSLPIAADLLALTPAQWAERMTGQWAVSAGALVAYTPPPVALTLAQQAAAASVAGLTIDLNGTVALFPTDGATQGYINAEVTSLLLNSTFADGTTAVEWPDATGTLHNLSVPQFKAVAGAIGGYVAACRKCVIGSVGAVLPASSITITV